MVLNMLDGILTYIGITSGFITEGNPLLSALSPLTILMGKLLLSLCLYGLLFTSFASIRSRLWRYGLIAANSLYSMILLLHLLWLYLLLL
ncbi:hypothetical protein B0X71_15455 [Planococcus lenghuensis]|uniref:DUF5658 domain-containing protein n=1 Tax=Planococcus lenghuensis TaxID=2213202 RepID=A0A1Q2L403_9BACL|nr:hypothetical protein B0X71_15455 [Planococcus lenghuensis]